MFEKSLEFMTGNKKWMCKSWHRCRKTGGLFHIELTELTCLHPAKVYGKNSSHTKDTEVAL